MKKNTTKFSRRKHMRKIQPLGIRARWSKTTELERKKTMERVRAHLRQRNSAEENN